MVQLHKKASASGGLRPPDPLLGLRPWTPLGDFRPPDPQSFLCPPNNPVRSTPLFNTVSSHTCWSHIRRYRCFATRPSAGKSAKYHEEYCVCLSACLSVSPLSYHANRVAELRQFFCMLPVAVAQSFSDSVAIRYILPVFWKTSYFHAVGCIVSRKRRGQTTALIPTVFAQR